MASDVFGDVPNGALFHDQISAIAGAGITTGCGGGNYCPHDFIRREGMAAFMHRGYSRVGKVTFNDTIDQTADTAAATVGSGTMLMGLPNNGLAGAAGFIEANATATIQAPLTGCPCTYLFNLFDATANAYLNVSTMRQTVDNGPGFHNVALTGALGSTISGTHTIQLRALRTSGTGDALVVGVMTLTYHPFGHMGTNVLGASG